jgi:hypothetical protein
MAAVLALALAATCVAPWRRHRVTRGARSRRALRIGVVASAALAGLVLVIAVANTTSAARSPQTLAALLDGGW